MHIQQSPLRVIALSGLCVFNIFCRLNLSHPSPCAHYFIHRTIGKPAIKNLRILFFYLRISGKSSTFAGDLQTGGKSVTITNKSNNDTALMKT